MKRLALPLFLIGLGQTAGAQAIDSFVVEAGGGDRVQMARFGTTWQWNKQWFTEGHWHLTGYWEADAGYWHASGPGGKDLIEAGFTPVFRLRPNAIGGTQPYWEAGVGVRILSSTQVDDDRDLGSALQFAEHLGFGFTFGGKSRYDLGYRLQHISNAGLQEPNNGMTLQQVRLSYLY